MGGGIAGHLANLGFEVLLFDITQDTARAGLEKAISARPPHFYDRDASQRVTVHSVRTDLEKIADADWVCEAVVEKMDVKRELYGRIEPLLREDAMITTNTSGLEISLLVEGRSESFRNRFLGTHFFNPPRYLKLIELIPTQFTDPNAVPAITRFLEDRAGRRVVVAKDTPGFIANRYGMWCLLQAIHTAERLRFSVETVDAITGPFMGRPKTGTFRLADLIGLDIMEDIAGNIRDRCAHDPQRDVLRLPQTVRKLLVSGRIGSKACRGYYQRAGKQFLSLDFQADAYRARQDADLPVLGDLSKLDLAERLRKALESHDEVGEFLRGHLAPALAYAAEIGEEISCSVHDFDCVMRWGWGWKLGPFELIDAIGYDTLKTYWDAAPMSENAPFYRGGTALNFCSGGPEVLESDERFASVSDFNVASSGDGWKLREDGKGGFIFQYMTKMNVLNSTVLRALMEHIAQHPDDRLTLANDGRGFCPGYDLTIFLKAAEEGRFDEIADWLVELQSAGKALRGVPSVAAIYGFALAGGIELPMHCRLIVADPETTLGLPEVSVGIVPAAGGTTLMRIRSQHDAHLMTEAAIRLAAGRKSPAHQGKRHLYLRESDVLAPNPDQLLFTALQADPGQLPPVEWRPAQGPVAGMIEREIEVLKENGELEEYGVHLAQQIKHLFVKPTTYEEALDMEREVFLSLIGKPMTVARIKHMLDTGKPLKN